MPDAWGGISAAEALTGARRLSATLRESSWSPRPQPPPHLTVTLVADAGRFLAAVDRVSRELDRFATTTRRAVDAVGLQRRLRAGAHVDDDPATWQCPPCGGWIHDQCAEVLDPGVGCRCTCRGGTIR